ncbi:MAG: hypothetical protein K2X74_06580 [Acetobacteraceae bacterium]|nr:hypothetical protein [Acetobacteraceae bacterium]
MPARPPVPAPRAFVRRARSYAFLGALLALACIVPDRRAAADPESLGLLWLPEGRALSAPVPVVIALHDLTGIDSRGWHYAEHFTAAGMAVLHVELLESSADGAGTMATGDDASLAHARLTLVIDSLAEDARFAGAPIGLLAFGGAGQVALDAVTDTRDGGRFAALALLYPGCATMAANVAAENTAPRSPILLLHGNSDPANLPADCRALADRLARTAPVQHRQHAGAGYAWDRIPYGLHEAVKMPWPGRPGALVPAGHSPEAAQRSAAQAAGFFTALLVAPPP